MCFTGLRDVQGRYFGGSCCCCYLFLMKFMQPFVLFWCRGGGRQYASPPHLAKNCLYTNNAVNWVEAWVQDGSALGGGSVDIDKLQLGRLSSGSRFSADSRFSGLRFSGSLLPDSSELTMDVDGCLGADKRLSGGLLQKELLDKTSILSKQGYLNTFQKHLVRAVSCFAFNACFCVHTHTRGTLDKHFEPPHN